MKKEELYEVLGDMDESYVRQAHMTTKKPHSSWIKWVAIAACLCVVVAAVIHIGIGFVPSQMTDHYREGNLIEITSESELPAAYDGNLLAFHLDFEKYELYYKTDGVAENTDDWYSLLASERNREGNIILHCLFGDTGVEDWKVSMVFTKEATQTKTINGVQVQIARLELSMQYEYWYYALFEYDDVVYDIRVQSNDAAYIYEVLNRLLGDISV